ncbi:MAG: isoprenyl transferase [Dysgonamonadaceae bacterium]|jgi:undecaprenyl diphosphate synthase|nr:isoprenyl transferase [Dysgonamonadaceae bacterium]
MNNKIDQSRIPQHVAIIMDGNGRWAKLHGKERVFGHQEGVVSVRTVVEAAAEIGIKYLTLYTFSTENWKRPQAEVDALMALMVEAVKRETGDLIRQNVRLLTIGDLSRLPKETSNNLRWSIEQTSACTGLHLVLALSYSSRWEITEASKQISIDVKNGELQPENVTEHLLSKYMTTKDIPDPDLLIRTGGERRISNFLMWQLSYAELYFTDTYWPDFREESLYESIVDYQSRERRFGKTGEQIQHENKSNP